MTNRYAARCDVCGCRVPARGGNIIRRPEGGWRITHLACLDETGNEKANAVVDIVIGGRHYTRNARGRCEDAPCCGCCTI